MKKILLLFTILVSIFFSSNKTYSQDFWEKINSIKGDIKSIQINSQNHLFVGSLYDGIFRSTDNGQTWSSVNTGLTKNFMGVLTISKKTQSLIAGGFNDISRSTNEGATWDSISANIFPMNLTSNDSGEIYAGTPVDGVIHSTDDGFTWEHIYNGLTQFSIYAFAFSLNNLYTSSYNGAVYKSTNNGELWIPIPISNVHSDVNALLYINQTLFAGTTNGIYKTNDEGTTWLPASSSTQNYQIMKLISDQYGFIYAVTINNGIIRSKDNGLSWIQINSGLTDFDLSCITISKDGYIYLGTHNGNIFSTINPISDIKQTQSKIPDAYELYQNYPNPFNPTTVISYRLPVVSNVTLKVYDVLGREVATLVNEPKTPGNYEVTFDGSDLSSGIYFYRLQVNSQGSAESFSQTKKFVLMK